MNRRFPPKQVDDEHNIYRAVKIYIPRANYAEIHKRAAELGLPMSRLCAWALDNEMDAPTPFNYPCDLPTSPYVPNAYADEAGKIVRLLEKAPGGLSRDAIMLSRREMGLIDRDVVMLALRELLEVDIVEEVSPGKRTKFKYRDDYRVIRLKNVDKKVLKAGKSRVDMIDEKMRKLEEERKQALEYERTKDNE